MLPLIKNRNFQIKIFFSQELITLYFDEKKVALQFGQISKHWLVCDQHSVKCLGNTGWGKSKFIVVSAGNTEFIFALLLICYCIIFHLKNCKHTLPHPVLFFNVKCPQPLLTAIAKPDSNLYLLPCSSPFYFLPLPHQTPGSERWKTRCLAFLKLWKARDHWSSKFPYNEGRNRPREILWEYDLKEYMCLQERILKIIQFCLVKTISKFDIWSQTFVNHTNFGTGVIFVKLKYYIQWHTFCIIKRQ